MSFVLSPEREKQLKEILARYPNKMAACIPVLHLAQDQNGWIDEEVTAWVADTLDLSTAHVFGVATFYSLFNKEPVGTHQVWVCRTLSCALNGAGGIISHVEKRLGVHCGQTTADGKVTLLDSLPDPTGETPYRTPTGKPFEAGTRGFWKDYPNIEALVGSLGLKEEDVFTPFTNSSFYSPDGLEATAPVFSSATIPFTESPLPELPSPLGQVAATFQLFESIPVLDRVTVPGLLYLTLTLTLTLILTPPNLALALTLNPHSHPEQVLGLLYAMADFTRDEETFRGYDRMTAHELFLRMGISERFVRDFLKPTLLVRRTPLGPAPLGARHPHRVPYRPPTVHPTARTGWA